MMSSECPHGHQALGGGLLPVNLAAGATFDPELLGRLRGLRPSAEMRSCGAGAHVCSRYAPGPEMGKKRRVLFRGSLSFLPDGSSGRHRHAVRGRRAAWPSISARQGETTGGVNASAARIGEQELREIHFPAMQACCEAGVEGVMAAYNEIDGVYCHSNAWLLRDVLRDEMGFDGIVMADGLAVDFLKNTEGDTLHAGATALKAGVDVGCGTNPFRLGEAVEKGLLDEKLLDEAVLRVLELKFKQVCSNILIWKKTCFPRRKQASRRHP